MWSEGRHARRGRGAQGRARETSLPEDDGIPYPAYVTNPEPTQIAHNAVMRVTSVPRVDP
ncbi:hypothetical protein Slu03_20220 [Sediminihabitans luteus]|nr:hypothetical protein Slu03_20220 [Sediminihabitans luteus]